MTPKNPEFRYWMLIFAVYGIPNLLMYLSMVDSPIFNVELKPIWSRLDFLTLLACIALVFLSLAFVRWCARFGARFFPDRQSGLPPKLLGVVVFLIQMNGLLAVLLLDFGRVGGTSTSSSFMAIFVSYLRPDAIFLAYYGHSRGRKVPYLNLLVFIVSNVMRGWGGVWLMLFLIEFYYVAQRFTGKKLFVASSLMIVVALGALPFVIDARDKTRGTEATEQTTLFNAVNKTLERLQQVTAVALIAQEAPVIKRAIQQGHILPFYEDNQVAEKLMSSAAMPISLQKLLSVRYLIANEDVPRGYYLEDVGWYVHTGIAGWLFVLDWSVMPFYLLFVGILIVLPYWISGRFIGAPSMLPVLHTVAVLYVFHGWFGVQIGFCIALIFYAVLLQTLRYLANHSVSAGMFIDGIRARN